MSTLNAPPFSLKLMINKQKSRVLFAESGTDVADVLLSFLTLPLGKIMRIIEQHYAEDAPVIGSLTSLYRGLSNLDSTYFCVEGAKLMLLNPRISVEAELCCRVKLDTTDSQKIKYFICQDLGCGRSQASNISAHSDVAACDCGKPLNRELLLAGVERSGVFIMKAPTSFIICDDLRVVPVASSGFLQTLQNLGVTDFDGAELTTFIIGIDDIIDLLKISLTSATPLTDLVINKSQKSSMAAKPKPEISSKEVNNTRKMRLKIFLQKSTNKFLLAEATDEFVEFLFSFLAIPLGGVEFLLRGKSCLKNIDNLYRSVAVIDKECFKTSDTKIGLINPKLGHGYTSKPQFLPLAEEFMKLKLGNGVSVSSFKSSKGQRNFLKEETMYIVSDNLTVMPIGKASRVSIPIAVGVSLSDVKEMDLQIGMEEALCILKASLWSTTVLTIEAAEARTMSFIQLAGQIINLLLFYYMFLDGNHYDPIPL